MEKLKEKNENLLSVLPHIDWNYVVSKSIVIFWRNIAMATKKILEKNFRWRKCLVVMAEKFSSYPLPETAKEWIIPLIKQSKPPPLF